MKSIFDPDFKYVPAAQTDLRKTFSRIRREMKEAKQLAEAKVKTGEHRIVPLPRKKGF